MLGLVARNSLTISLAQALLLLGVWSYVLCRGSLARLSCYRECPEIVDAGQSVDVRLTVTNQGWLPGYLVEVTDWFPADRQPLKRMLLSGLAPRARAASVGYQAVCNAGRGVYQLAPLELATSDPLGLFRARRVVSLEQEVVVYPQPLSSLPPSLPQPLQPLSPPLLPPVLAPVHGR